MIGSGGPRHPVDRWLMPAMALLTIAAILGGVLFYRAMVGDRSFTSLPEAAREELAAVAIVPDASAKVEQTWVADFGTQDYLIAPVGALPCDGAENSLRNGNAVARAREAMALRGAGDVDSRIDHLGSIASVDRSNLLVALIFGTEAINAGRYNDASQVLGEALAQSNEDNEVIRNARDPRLRLDLGDSDVATVIYLYHGLGVAQLRQSGTGAPWVALKNVIGGVKALSQRRLLGTAAGAPTWSKLRIQPPGCSSAGAGSISTYDLYNNLIVGYMKGDFVGDTVMRRVEFRRDAKPFPSGVHRLLLAQIAIAEKNGWQNESELWALSNVEQVLDWRVPDDARLAINAIRVIDWWLAPERCPQDVCTAELRLDLEKQKDELLLQAFKRRNVSTDQQRPFAQMATSLLARSGVDRSAVADGAEAIRGWLPQSQASTLADLIAADVIRQKLPRVVVGLDDGAETARKLDRRGGEWRQAAEADFTASAAQWAKTRSPAEQRAVLVAGWQLLGTRAAPAAVTELFNSRSLWDRVRIRVTASKWAWALLALLLTAIVWFGLLCLAMLIRDWRVLHTSFYNVELEYLRSSEPPVGRSER